MLTVELLRQNQQLTGLTDSQMSAIAEMSKNDENTVIGTRIGELHGQYDADILGISGVAKNTGEKSYDYAKRVLNDYKAKLDATKTLQAQLANANTKITELNDKLAKGGADESLKQQLKDAKSLVTQLQTQLSTKETEFTQKETKLNQQIKDVHVDYAFKAALSGIKFKQGISEPIQNIILDSVKNEVLSKGTPDFVDINGKKELVLRDDKGVILTNPKNNLNPFTIKELVMETSLKDVIDTAKHTTGGGTTGEHDEEHLELIDISAARTQVEADDIIEKKLLSEGLTRDSDEFSDKMIQLRADNGVDKLPIR